jgi:hypothetical protein
MRQNPWQLIAAAILALLSQRVTASTGEELESGLISAMRLNKETRERVGNSGKAIQAYMREGYVNPKPNRRVGYTDYYLVKKPASFMHHELVMIEEEYMVEFIGCCVSAGVGVTLRVSGSTGNLEDFAEQNGCRVEPNVDFQQKAEDLWVKEKVAKGNYVWVSCRERDVMQ